MARTIEPKGRRTTDGLLTRKGLLTDDPFLDNIALLGLMMDETFDEFFHWYGVHKTQGLQRRGQAIFNAAAAAFPDHAEMLRASSVDPFYNDGKVNAFLWTLIELITEP